MNISDQGAIKPLLIVALHFSLVITSFAQDKKIRQLPKTKISVVSLTHSIQTIVDTGKITGLSVVIINDNKVVYNKSFGKAVKGEKQVPLSDSTIMYAASFTKPLAAYLFLKLVDQGIFHLDTPIQRYLKNPISQYERWKDIASSPGYEKITSRMLLSHSSGIPILRFLYNDKLELIAPPGEKFYYSNEAFNLLGFMIEEYTGKKLEDLANNLVFTPLSMGNTSMIWEGRFDKNYALGYDEAGKLIGMNKRTASRAAGSMSTTSLDYAKFIIALLKKKGLSKNMFKEMMQPQIAVRSNRGFGPQRDSMTGKFENIQLSWGLGVGLFRSQFGKAFFHTGHSDGWQNFFVAFPKKKTAIILMSNSSNLEKAIPQILNLSIGVNIHYSPLEWLGYFDLQ